MEENLGGKKEKGENKNLNSNSNKENLLPLGFRFRPTADELVLDFLLNKIMGYKPPCDLIQEIDFYAYDAHELPMSQYKFGCEAQAYFFTLMQQSLTETNRITKGGYWEATGAEKKIYHESEIVGFRNSFLFYMGKPPKGKKSSWVMKEFRVSPSLVPVEEFGDSLKTKFERYVVCKIKNIAI